MKLDDEVINSKSENFGFSECPSWSIENKDYEKSISDFKKFAKNLNFKPEDCLIDNPLKPVGEIGMKTMLQLLANWTLHKGLSQTSNWNLLIKLSCRNGAKQLTCPRCKLQYYERENLKKMKTRIFNFDCMNNKKRNYETEETKTNPRKLRTRT